MSTILTATDVVVRYNEQTVLDRATLAIDEGDRIGLGRAHGCGKTTFLKLLPARKTRTVARSAGGAISWSIISRRISRLIRRRAFTKTSGTARRHVLDLIASLNRCPPNRKRHEELEHRNRRPRRLDARHAPRHRHGRT